jgi:hypothetical protein
MLDHPIIKVSHQSLPRKRPRKHKHPMFEFPPPVPDVQTGSSLAIGRRMRSPHVATNIGWKPVRGF